WLKIARPPADPQAGQREVTRDARDEIASPTPPRMATAESSRRGVRRSPSSRTPASAARTGTASWIVPARVALSRGSTLYHAAYPPADASAPEAKAHAIPTPLRCAWVAPAAPSSSPKGVASRKAEAFSLRGATDPRPRRE